MSEFFPVKKIGVKQVPNLLRSFFSQMRPRFGSRLCFPNLVLAEERDLSFTQHGFKIIQLPQLLTERFLGSSPNESLSQL